MGWFDEQIRLRKKSDKTVYENAYNQLSQAVMGKRIKEAFENESKKALDAIRDILVYYDAKIVEVPNNLDNLDEEIELLCRPNGIMKRTINLQKGWHRNAFGAMMCILKESGRPVALLQNKLDHYYYYDETGSKVFVTGKNEDAFEKQGYVFYKPFPLKSMTLKDLIIFAFKSSSKVDMVIPVIITGIITFIGLLIPILTNFLFGEVIKNNSYSLLLATMVFFASVTISRILMNLVHSLALAARSTAMSIKVEAATMMRVLTMPTSFFKNNSSGELTTKIGYVSSLCVTILNTILDTGATTIFSLAYIAQVFTFARTLLLPAIVIILLTLAVTLLNIKLQMKISLKEMETHAKENGISLALINGIQKIKLAGAEKRAFGKWARAYADNLVKRPTFNVVSGAILTGISLFGTIVIYYCAFTSHMSVSEYYAFNSAYGMVSGAFMSIATVVQTVAQIKPMMRMIQPILETAPEVNDAKHNVTSLTGAIELNRVSFKYSESMPNVIDDLSLKIRPGEYIAIVGKTGCGKSTLIRLLLGFEKPQKGGIFYDGKNIDNLELRSLRRKIGTVTQDGKLFTGSIAENILITAPWMTMDDAWNAAEKAAIADDIRNMPMGMQTMLSEGSGGISGGQKQRLMIARAIAPKPRILLFDEATSALDNITQKKVSESLDALKCTRIVVAHRLSTIKNCSRIIVLDGGKIVEDGTYEELIKLNGFFAELVERQRLDVKSK